MKLALTIRGGGNRSVAYAGALTAFEELGIQFSHIVGSSGGAVVGGSYAYGKTPAEIAAHFAKFNAFSGINLKTISQGRLLDPASWIEHAAGLVGEAKFSDCKIPFAARTINLTTGEPIFLETGELKHAVVASAAIPFLVGPLKYRGKHMIDGEVVPHFGADYLRSHGADLVIGLTIRFPNRKFKGFAGELNRYVALLQQEIEKQDLVINPLDHLVSIDLPYSSIFTNQELDKYFELGYAAVMNERTKLSAFVNA